MKQQASQHHADRRYRIAAVEKALWVLDVFAEAPHRFTLTEISEQTKLSPNQVFRLLQTLVTAGYVREESDSKFYRLGWSIFGLAAALMHGDDLLLATSEPLQWAYEQTGETVAVMVPDGNNATIGVNVRQSQHPLLASEKIGGRSSELHAGAAGKMLLATWSDDMIERYLADHPTLARYTRYTPATPEAVRAEIRKVRAQGFAVSNQEIAEGMYGMAAPVYDQSGTLAAVMTLAAPVARAGAVDQERHRVVLLEAARRISLQLGFRAEAALV